MHPILKSGSALPILLAGCLSATMALAAESTTLTAADRKDLAVTVYNQNLGLVRDRRAASFDEGANSLTLEGVSPQLRPESLILRGDGLQVLEQTFSFDLLTQQALLAASVGKTVFWRQVDPASGKESLTEATLLSNAQGPVLQVGDRIRAVSPDQVVFAELPGNLRAAPALLAVVQSDAAGAKDLEIQYLTSGLSWQADYVAELNTAEDRLDITALVTLTNGSDADYPAAEMRLVAGQVNQTGPRPVAQQRGEMLAMAEAAAAPAPNLAAQSVSDRYVYNLPAPVTLLRQEAKQVPLFAAAGVEVKRSYRFDSLIQANRALEEIGPLNADIYLALKNGKDEGLGRPLPAGTVRVYQLQSEGAPIFAGEAAIKHTAEDETLDLALGQAFDITGTAKLSNYRRISNSTGAYEMGQSMTVKNAKDQDVEVEVVGHMPRGWRMLDESQKHEKTSANRLVWTLKVPAKGEAKLNYSVQVNP